MGEAVKSAAINGEQTDVSIEYEVIYEGSSVADKVIPEKC